MTVAVAYASLVVGLMSCLLLPVGLLLFSSRRKKGKGEEVQGQSSLFWQFKKLEILALNLEDGRQYIGEAVLTVIVAAEKLRTEIGCMRGCLGTFPEERRMRLIEELEGIERSCDSLIRNAQFLASRCGSRSVSDAASPEVI